MNEMHVISLLEELKGNPFYKDITYRHEPNAIVVGLECTIYDYYELQPLALLDLLKENNISYEWYNSVEIELYVK